jgi:hypothetical protein
MKADLVDPVAVAVVSAQPGRVVVGVEGPAHGLRPPGCGADLANVVDGPLAALAPKRLDQDPIGLERVVVLERRRLIRDFVGRVPVEGLLKR